MSEAPRAMVLDASAGPELPIVAEGGRAHAIVWPGMGAELRSMSRIVLEPGGGTVELQHPSEAVYYVVSGSGEVTAESGGGDLVTGSMVHVGPGDSYAFRAGDQGMEIVGGPSPADPALYEGV